MESFIERLRRRATGIIPEEDFSSMDSDLMPPQVNEQGVVPNPSYKRKESPLVNPNVDPFNNFQKKKQIPGMTAPDAVTGLGLSNEQSKRFFGMDLASIRSQWKDKGGFEGLMANPAFTLGLGLMKSSATGQPISQSLLNNAVTAGAISGEYAERIKKRSEVLAPVTEGQRDEVAAVLAEDNYYEPNILDKLKKGNQSAKYREALDDVYDRADKLAKAEAKKSGKSVRFGRKHIRAALKQMEAKGEIKRRDPSFFGIIGGTIESTKGIGKRAKGGPVTENKPYIVGEEGAEMFVPQVDGNIIDNDDTKVVNMLLESNPQLKNVSRARAVKILKNRFPDYF